MDENVKQETAKTEEVKTETSTDAQPKLSAEELKNIAKDAFANVAKEFSENKVDKSNVPSIPNANTTMSKNEKNAEVRKWMREANTKGLTEATASSGTAVATPTVITSEILRLMAETGVVRRNAQIFPMTSMTMTVRVTDTEDEASWMGQATARDATSPTFTDVTFTRTNLGKTNLVSNALIQDAGTDLVGLLSGIGSTSLRKAEDKAMFVGNGSNITGLVNETGLNEVELVGTITQGALTYQKILDLVNAGTHERTGNEKLYMNRITWSAVCGLEDTNGNLIAGTDNILEPNFKGVPVEFVSHMVNPVTGDGTNKCYMIYGDLKNAGLAVRNDEATAVNVRMSDSAVVGGVSCWETRQTAFAFDEDVDIKVLFPSAFSKITSAH